jgi:hypothetical protein
VPLDIHRWQQKLYVTMEHLMLPAGIELTEQELIPCLCLNDYIGIPFLDYPSKTNPNYQIPNDE